LMTKDRWVLKKNLNYKGVLFFNSIIVVVFYSSSINFGTITLREFQIWFMLSTTQDEFTHQVLSPKFSKNLCKLLCLKNKFNIYFFFLKFYYKTISCATKKFCVLFWTKNCEKCSLTNHHFHKNQRQRQPILKTNLFKLHLLNFLF
jgi:hypothetical protein